MLYPPNNQTHQTLKTQSSVPESPSTSLPTQSRSVSKTLLILMILLIVQLMLAIAVLVIKIIFGFIGLDSKSNLALTNASASVTCYDPVGNFKYMGNQTNIFSLALISIAMCIALTIILLIITIRSLHLSRKLVNLPTLQNSLTLSQLYLVVGPKTRALMYILQSVCILTAIIVFGYYLSYYLYTPNDTCSWNINKTNVLILAIIAGVLLIIALVCWIIIVFINLRNRRDADYLQQKSQYKNVNNTETEQKPQRQKTAQQQPKQQAPPKHYNSPSIYQPSSPQKSKINIYQPKKQPQQNPTNQYIYQNTGYYDNTKPNPNNNSNPDPNRYNSAENVNKKPENEYYNPIFKNRKDLYESPYNRIENGGYYEGDRKYNTDDRNRVDDGAKEKQFERSRIRNQPNIYDPNQGTTPNQDDAYLRILSRYRVQQQDRGLFKPVDGQRRILPEGNRSNSPNNYEGSKPRLHSNYFKQEPDFKRRPQNSHDKKRKGILNDYIRGKYTDS